MKGIYVSLLVCAITGCTKDIGTNPDQAFSTKALVDSCRSTTYAYYMNNSSVLIPPAGNSPHSEFRLRFNHKAVAALTEGGKLPAGKVLPDGSMVIKDAYRNGTLNIYAFMYKRNGAWLWGEAEANGTIHHSVLQPASVCTGCHSQPGQRDFVLSFSLH